MLDKDYFIFFQNKTEQNLIDQHLVAGNANWFDRIDVCFRYADIWKYGLNVGKGSGANKSLSD
jgi:hypothetical protein